MKKIAAIRTIGILLLCASFSFGQTEKPSTGTVCGKPSECQNKKPFEPNDLTFRLPAKLKWQTNYTSDYFYAVILQSRRAVKDENVDSENCSKAYFSESERVRVQNLFPDQKVFTSRNGCYGAWGAVYTNVNSDYEFIAAFGGVTQSQAGR
jgi:hypothetical protein